MTAVETRRSAVRENRHEYNARDRCGGDGAGLGGVLLMVAEPRHIYAETDHGDADDQSDPPGAEARTSLGGLCRTPCTQQVPVANEFTVSYALNGYTPQSVTVRPAAGGSTVEPNPVLATLQSAAPPPKAPPKKRKRPAAKPAPSAEPAPTAEAPQPSMGNIAPPPGAFTPPPR